MLYASFTSLALTVNLQQSFCSNYSKDLFDDVAAISHRICAALKLSKMYERHHHLETSRWSHVKKKNPKKNICMGRKGDDIFSQRKESIHTMRTK